MTVSPTEGAPCARCATLVDPQKAFMTSAGPICVACEDKEGLGDAFERAAKYYSVGAVTAAGVSFFFNPFMIASLVALSLGITGLVRLTMGSAARDYAEVLGKKRYWHIGLCGVAAFLGGLPVLKVAVLLVLVAAR